MARLSKSLLCFLVCFHISISSPFLDNCRVLSVPQGDSWPHVRLSYLLVPFLLDVDHWHSHFFFSFYPDYSIKISGGFSCAPEVVFFWGHSQNLPSCVMPRIKVSRENEAPEIYVISRWLSLSEILVCLTHCFSSSLMALYKFLLLFQYSFSNLLFCEEYLPTTNCTSK